MIPVLFKEDEQVFTHNGIGALYESLSCDVLEEENGAFTMELEYPVDGELFSEIKDFRIIQAKPNDIDEPHNFRIYEIEKSIDELTVYVRANTRTNDLGNNLIKYYAGKDVTPQQAMNGIKSNLIEPTNFDLISDIQTKSNVEWTRVNPLNAIVGTRGSLVDIWGGQIKRTNTAIYLYSRRGRDNVVTIRPGKNIEGLKMTVSTAGLVTKILPTFSYRPVDVPKYQMVTLEDGTKEKRRVQTSGSTTLRDDITVLGDVVSSQYVDNYPTNYWSSVDYGDDDNLKNKVDTYIDTKLKHAEESPGIVDMSGFETDLKKFVKTELDKKAKQYFTHRNPGVDRPTVRITVDMLQLSDSPDWEEFKDLEQIGLTDTLDVWVEEYDIDVEVRVTSLTYDSIAEHVIGFNAGSDKAPRQSAIEKKYDDLTRSTNDYITSFKNGVRNIMRNTADGLNRKFEGYTEPPAELSSEGDIWFKEIGEGKVEIWIHDGTYWQPLMTEDFGKKIEADIEAVQSELDEAKLQAITDSEQALADAKAHAEAEDARIRGELESDIGGAITLAEQAKQDAIDKANQALVDAKAHADAEIVLIETHFDDIIEGVESDVLDAKQTADDALYKINNDIANKFTSLDAELVDIEAISNTAKTNAHTALNQSQEALTDAGTALTDASQALTEVQKKVNTIDFDNIVNDIETGVQEAMDEAELATNTLRDSTGQLIKSQDLKVDIDGITSSLTSYAKTTDLNGLATETFVTNKGYQTAAQVSSTLGAYAKTTDLNGLVSQTWVENKGYATASEVSSELSSYAKSSDLTGLATEKFVTTRGYQTSSQISTTLSAYEKTSTLNTKLAGKANVGDIPSLTGYGKEAWVENKSYATGGTVATSLKAYEKTKDVNAKLADKADIDDIPDITGLASETWVENKSYATAASVTTQLSSYAKTSQLTGLATEKFVTNKGYQTAAQVSTTLSSYAKSSDLTGLATEKFVTSKGYQTASQVSTTLKSYAKTTDLSGLATQTYVTSRGYQTASQITTTLKAYAKTSQLSGLATETFVTNKGYQTASQVSTTLSSYVKTSTLSGYATVATVNAIKSTADTNKATISTNTGKISTIEQNVSGLQTTVASKAAQSQVTQLATGLSSVVKDLDDLEIGGRNLYLNSGREITSSGYTISSYNFATKPIAGEKYTLSIKGKINPEYHTGYYTNIYNGSAHPAMITVGPEDLDSDGVYRKTFTMPHLADYISTILYSYPLGKYVEASVEWIKLEKGNKATDWSPAPEDVQSQITQNANNINLRVAKNDVVNQINVSTEGILIDGKKVHITGTTKIDNGVIKNAHIGTLDAAKINTGTIKAARLDSKAIVTAGLTANVIKSTHIETSTATVDKLFATDAMVNTLTAKTAFISSVKAVNIDAARITTGTINAARLNAKSIVTAGLTANVIKSTHIDGNTALFDKLFSTASATDRLSARTAWIKTANIADLNITNAKIANGTIASAKIASLDVSKISGNKSSFVETNWNAINANIDINGERIRFESLDGKSVTQVYNSGFDFIYQGISVGRLGLNYTVNSTQAFLSLSTEAGQGMNFAKKATAGATTYETIFEVPSAGMELRMQKSLNINGQNILNASSIYSPQFVLSDGLTTTAVGRFITVGAIATLRAATQLNLQIGTTSIASVTADSFNLHKNLNANGHNITNMASVYYGANMEIRKVNANTLDVRSNTQLRLMSNGTTIVDVLYNGGTTRGVNMHANLNMQGFTVTGQSDSRLKTNITDHQESSLQKISEFIFKDFTWIETGRDDFGLIAQEVQQVVPELVIEGTDGYLSLDNSLLNMMTAHGLQELDSKVDIIAKTNEDKIHQLQQELSKANRRIEELEGAM